MKLVSAFRFARAAVKALLPRAAFASAFAAIVLAVSTFGVLVPPQQHTVLGFSFGRGASTPHCVTVMVDAYKKLDASGIWDCFAPKLQQGFYTNSGLQGASALAASVFAKYKDGGVTVEVTQYMHNPVCAALAAAPSGQSCNAWILYLTPIVAGIRVDTSATSLTIFIDSAGLIWALS